MSVFKATKKPVTIEAMLWDKSKSSQQSVIEFVPMDLRRTNFEGLSISNCPEVYLITLEGEMHVSDGDYIIKGIHGEFYPCKPDIFKATYNYRCKRGEDIYFSSISSISSISCIYCEN